MLREARLPSELLYVLPRRANAVFPADATAEEFHSTLFNALSLKKNKKKSGRSNPSSPTRIGDDSGSGAFPSSPSSPSRRRAFLEGALEGSDAVAPLVMSTYVNARDFGKVLEALDPVALAKERLNAAKVLLGGADADRPDYFFNDDEDRTTRERTNPLPAALTELQTDEEALIGGRSLSFLQRFALAADAQEWLATSKGLTQTLRAATGPVRGGGGDGAPPSACS